MDVEDEIAERIFTCLQRMNFKLAAQVLQEWELTDAGSNIILTEDQLWSRGKDNLAKAYHDLKEDTIQGECAISDGRLIAVCMFNSVEGFHFQLEFMLCRAESNDGVG